MKFVLAAILARLAKANNEFSDVYYHERPHLGPSIWAMGKSGVAIYSVDGTTKLKEVPNTHICEQYTDARTGEVSQDCAFRDAISDGVRHVYASNSNGSPTIEVFSVNTGDFVASLPTCGSPVQLDYHPIREELWVHCWSPNPSEGDTGHIDVISANALSLDATQVKLSPELAEHGHGQVVVDTTLGNYGYASDLGTPSLFRFDASTKEVEREIPIDHISGLNRMVYSHKNRHLYVRTYVCCSCGFEGSNLGEECGRGESRLVDVTTGGNRANNVTGVCGHGCSGSSADVVGVVEIDTASMAVVTNWQAPNGRGGDPSISPDGNFIALFSEDGGKQVRILKAGANGEKATIWKDVETNFGAADGEKAVSDVIYVQDSDHNIAIFSSTLSNDVVLVDLSDSDMQTRKLTLTDSTEISSNHGRGARRNLAWAVGTDYVWVDGQASEELYVVQLSADGDIGKAQVVKTIQGAASRQLLFVQNYYVDEYRHRGTSNDHARGSSFGSSSNDENKNDAKANAGIALAAVSLLLSLAAVLFAVLRGNKQVELKSDDIKDETGPSESESETGGVFKYA